LGLSCSYQFNYIIIDGCKIGLNVPASGISATNCGHCEVMNCTFDTGDRNMDAWEAENEEDGLHLHNGCNNWNVHNNIFKDWGHCCLLLWGDNSSSMVTDINIYDNSFTDEDTDYGSAVTINGFTGGMARVHIYRNYMYKMGTNNQFCTDGELIFYDNIIDGTKGNTYKPSKSGYGIACLAYGNEQGIGQKFYNNTIINCLDGAVILINYALSMYVYNNEFINNIFANNGTNNSNLQIYIGANSPTNGYYVLNNTFKNNLIYSSATNNVIYYGHSPSYPSSTSYTIVQFNAANGTQGDVISGNLSGNPVFVSSTDFRLQSGSPAIGKGLLITGLTTDYTGTTLSNPPSIGAYESGSPAPAPAVPVYVSSAITNATPTLLEITYNLTLANIVPTASSFSVLVNSVARTVNAVAISGTKVQLTLASPIVYGNVVTVSYNKPSANPLQATSGGQAVTIVSQTVINNVNSAIPVYVSSVVQNATPTLLEMTYSTTLANIVPAASSFSVLVNSIARTVNAVALSGTKVQLTLTSRIVSGDIVTVSYIKPSNNPTQTTSGGIASGITNQQVLNNCINIAPTAVITSPGINSSFASPANFTITANALDADGSISMVEFYNGSTKLGSISAAPYSFTWNNVAAGNYSLTVIATDNLNAKTTSSAVSISVTNSNPVENIHPIVKISNPLKGISFQNISTIEIDAIASDPDGTISKVEFYNGSVKLVELTSAPYIFIWKDVAPGSYSITAIATDNLNDSTISLPVEFKVGAKIKYDANSEIVKLYPNPNDGHFSIEFISPLLSEKSQIIITDLAGKQVYNGPVLKEEILKQIDLSNSRSGMYVMMIKDKEILVTKKFIKK
jgi:uncharacterized repeat protein (TIGR02059 family)